MATISLWIGLSILGVLAGYWLLKNKGGRHAFLFILLPAALMWSAAIYYMNQPESIVNPGALKCRICGRSATRSLGAQTQDSKWFYGQPGETRPGPFSTTFTKYAYLYCEMHSKRLTNTPVQIAGSVLKCPDDRKNRVVSVQATYPCGSSTVGGRVCERRYAAERVLPESRFELQHSGSPSEKAASEEKAQTRFFGRSVGPGGAGRQEIAEAAR